MTRAQRNCERDAIECHGWIAIVDEIRCVHYNVHSSLNIEEFRLLNLAAILATERAGKKHGFCSEVTNGPWRITASGEREAGRVIVKRQKATIRAVGEAAVANLCAENHLGLSSHPKVIEAATDRLRTHGYGLSSVRYIVSGRATMPVSTLAFALLTVSANGQLFLPGKSLLNRKGRLFSDTVDGVKASANLDSLVETFQGQRRRAACLSLAPVRATAAL